MIPVEHDPTVYSIEATSTTSATAPIRLTLLELVMAVGEVSESEDELIASVLYILQDGRVRLAGNFRESRFDPLSD